MRSPAVSIPATKDTPSVHIRVNWMYALYQYLVLEGQRPREERNPKTAEAAGLAASARHLQGPHGIWDIWEQPLAAADTLDDAATGLTAALTCTVTQLTTALNGAEAVFRQQVWPARQPLIDAALVTLRDTLLPHFAAIALRQAALLDLVWPDSIDAYLVPASYAWEGAYSHPLTIDVSANSGLTLCETLLHEATHVADVHSAESGRQCLRDRLVAGLIGQGIPRPVAWNAWHGVIFAASAQQVRSLDPNYTDYALPRRLYDFLKVPELPAVWAAFASGEVDEDETIVAIGRQVLDHLTLG